MDMGKTNIKVKGHTGKWYEINRTQRGGRTLFLMEHQFYGDNAPCVIIDKDNTLIMEEVWNGFDDYDEAVESGHQLIY